MQRYTADLHALTLLGSVAVSAQAALPRKISPWPGGDPLGVGRRQWLFPCQVLQQRMARFFAQPEGPGLF